MPTDEGAAEPAPRDEAPEPAADAVPDEGHGFEAPIEPGSPSLESALFVLLGAIGALAVVLRLVQLFA